MNKSINEYLVHKFYNSRLITFLIVVLIFLFSIYSFQSLTIDAYPDISGVQVQIITEFTGRATEEVEEQVTIPLERSFAGISHLETIRSKSIFGLSVVQLLFSSDVTDEYAREQVNQRLQSIDLPDGISPKMGSFSTSYGEIYRYEVQKKEGISEIELREIQDWVIRPAFLRVRGVVEVINFGGLSKQYAVHVDPKKLIKFGIRLQDIVTAIIDNNNNGGGSIIERGSSSIVIRGIGRYYDFKEMENVFIKNSFGTDVFIKDIGKVEIDHKSVSGVFGKDNNSHSIEGIVKMRKGENPSIVLEQIHSITDNLNHYKLPNGIFIKPFYDRTTLIESTIFTVLKNTILGITFVIIVLYLFLREITLASIVALTIPFSLITALCLMYIFGVPISLLSIGSIDFGILVDGSVIIIENIYKKYQNSNKEKDNLILEATSEVQTPMLFSMGIVLIAYLPLLSLQKIEGLLFRPMAITICFALFGAILFSLFVLPSLTDILIKYVKFKEDENSLSSKIISIYKNTIIKILDSKNKFIKIIIVVYLISFIILYPKIGMEFLPYMDEGVFWLRANFPEGISLNETTQFSSQIRNILLDYEEVQFVTSQTGRNDDGTDPFPLNRIEFMIGLKEKENWKNYSNKIELERSIIQNLKDYFPTVRMNLTQPIIDSVTEDLNGTSADLAVDIEGKDLDKLREIAENVKFELKKIKGSVNVNIEQEAPQPQLKININKEKLSLYRISASAVNYVINTAIGGIPISEIYEEERKFEILVKYAPEFRETVSKLSLLPVFNEVGEAIPLGQLCEINVDDGETIIFRSNGNRRITVRTDIRYRAQNDFVNEAKDRIYPYLKNWEGVEISWLGMFENLSRAKKHFGILIPLSLLIIFFLLFIFYESYSLALLIIFTVPLSTLGSFYALAMRDYQLSVSAGVGFTTLFGIASMHGILLVSNISNLKRKGYSTRESILNGATARFRPVIMTASVAFIGLFPASLSGEIGSDIQRPIATVMIYGIITSAFLTLFLIPVLYEFLDQYKNKSNSINK